MLKTRQILRMATHTNVKISLRTTSLSSKKISTNLSSFRQNHISDGTKNFHTACKFLTAEQQATPMRKPIGKVEGRLQISFTCKRCNTRNTKTLSKLGYERGVVIVRCDGCKNNHLIADNLGWFSETDGKRNIEKMMREKGEFVRKINRNSEGSLELIIKEEYIESRSKNALEGETVTSEDENSKETDRHKCKS